MAKKHRIPTGTVPSAPAATAAPVGPAPEAGPIATAVLLALAMFLAPAVGVPHEEMLQDTLKSMLVAFAALAAALVFFWQQRARIEPLRWHAVLWLPLALSAYALGSMAWSHTYLAGVEAIRWFLFSLLAWLALNTFSRERLPLLAWGVHLGAVVAALWTALQFWIDFRFFPQGPNPASTFVNRNFFAEFVVCTLPFSVLLLARARQSAAVAFLAASTALVLVSILMTGTRSALMAMWLQLFLVLPLILWRHRRALAWPAWSSGTRWLAAVVLLGAVGGMGSVPSGNAAIVAEGRGAAALERGATRTRSISTKDASLGLRQIMWRATWGLIQARPLTGVGAGAWENEIPLYQTGGAQLETDYYVHNEFLQLVAEYGLVGAAVLLALFAYLVWAAWITWCAGRAGAAETAHEREEAPWRAVLLCSLLALLIVSNAGFPWRMASTGALFALALGALAASDARLGLMAPWASRALRWQPAWALPACGATVAALALASYISHQAAESERLIVRAARTALTISAAGDWNHPRWDGPKAEMLRMVREGVAINPHYRKITPMVADELARWGDWKNATWIWESVLSSRPNVVAILTNVARGYTAMDQPERAQDFLARAARIQPAAPAVRSLQVILLVRSGDEAGALQLSRQSLEDGVHDLDLLNTTFRLAWRAGDAQLAVRAMATRQVRFPEHRLDGHLQLGQFYASLSDEARAVAAYRAALALARPEQRAAVLAQVPPAWRDRLAAP